MDATQTYFTLKRRQIRLALTEDKTGLLAGPRESLTDELREAIRLNRDELMRVELFKEAARHVQDHLIGREGSLKTPAAKATHAAMAGAQDDLEEAWQAEDFEGFKETLREWVRLGLGAYRKARRDEAALEGPPDGARVPEVDPQPTLMTEEGERTAGRDVA